MSARDRFVQIALGEVGKSYASHRDCSGFTAWVARQVGVTIPEGSVAQYGVGEVVPLGKEQPGDLLFWDTFGQPPGHVGIYVGNREFVHAMNEQKGILVSPVSAYMGGNGGFMGARRIFTEGAHPPAPEKPGGAGVPLGELGAVPSPSTKPRDRQRKREKDRLRRRRRKA